MKLEIKQPKILVTGGAGFIGSNFISTYIDQYDILNIDKLTYAGSLESLKLISDKDNYNFVKADISNQTDIKKIINNYNPDYIINFAAESHVDRSIEDPFSFIRTNVLGVTTLLVESTNYYNSISSDKKRNFRFLHVSTDEVYGSLKLNEKKFSESTKYDPSSPYSASKASSDHLVNAWNRTYGLPTLITNCSNNYGPYQFPEKLIPHMIINCLLENNLPVYGKGQNIRDWLYVKDHCEAIHKVIMNGKISQTYNIGGNAEFSNIDIVNLICEKMDSMYPRKSKESYKDLIDFVDDRPGHDFRYAINTKKIAKELNWEPKFKFENAIDLTISWYIDNIEWWKSKINDKYDLSRLGVLK